MRRCTECERTEGRRLPTRAQPCQADFGKFCEVATPAERAAAPDKRKSKMKIKIRKRIKSKIKSKKIRIKHDSPSGAPFSTDA